MPPVRYPVLFVMAPGGCTYSFPEHLGTAFLRTVLRRAGIDSCQYLPKTNPALSGFAGFLRQVQPRVVGFTVYEASLRISQALVRTVRETLPEAVIIIGGPNATFTPQETLDLLGADICLRGAGEGTIVAIVSQILGSDTASRRLRELLRDVPNLVLRTANAACYTPCGDISSFPAKYFRTLDDIPSPFLENVVSTPEIGYLTSRGCNQHCTYCSFAEMSQRRVAFHSIERVLDDLKALEALFIRARRCATQVFIYDDTFSLVPERARRICEGIIERRIRLPLSCLTRADRVTPDLLRLMRRAGFVGISFGLESAVPRVLRTIGKVTAPDTTADPQLEAEQEYLERFRISVKSAKKCGLNVGLSVIGGLPGETAEDLQTTVDFVSSLNVRSYTQNVLNLFPGTPLHARRHEFGLDALREPRTAIWRTTHSYDVSAVRPLRHSTEHQLRWEAAEKLADALCGRSHESEADGASVWAVVIHNLGPSRKLAAWLRQILAIGGSILVFARSRTATATWRAFLAQARVPFGALSCLVPDGSKQRMSFDVLGAFRQHHVRFLASCSPDLATNPLTADEDGNCRISVWLAGAPDTQLPRHPTWQCPVIGPGLQIADSCRLGIVPRRCERPNVLHVDSAGHIRACWYGPIIGSVGDGMTRIVSRGRSLRAPVAASGRSARSSPHCPVPLPAGMNDVMHSRLWDLDVASQLSWLFRSSDGAGDSSGRARA